MAEVKKTKKAATTKAVKKETAAAKPKTETKVKDTTTPAAKKTAKTATDKKTPIKRSSKTNNPTLEKELAREERIQQNRKGVKESNEKLPDNLKVNVPTRSGFGAKVRRPNLKNYNLEDDLFVEYEDSLKERKDPRVEALRRLKNGMDVNNQITFKGIVTGMNTYVNPQTGESKSCAIVNTTVGVENFAGKIVRIFYEDFMLPQGTEGSVMKEAKSYINSRIGAEVDFVVINMIDNGKGDMTVLGSRRRAGEKKFRKYWIGKRDGEYLLHEGRVVEGRVLYVDKYGLTTEIFGEEFFVAARHLSYNTINDCRDLFKVGQKVPFKILKLNRDGKGKVTAELSHKATFEDSRIEYMKDYHVGDKLECVVKKITDYSDNYQTVNIFVNVEGKFDILCHMKENTEVMPIEGETVKLVIHGIALPPESEEPKIWGEIFHVHYK